MANINSNYVTKFNLGIDEDIVFDQYSFYTLDNHFCVITTHKVKVNSEITEDEDVDNLYFCEIWFDNEYLMETSVNDFNDSVAEAFELIKINNNNII